MSMIPFTYNSQNKKSNSFLENNEIFNSKMLKSCYNMTE